MGRLVVAGSALIAVTYGLARFALGLFVPELRDEFDLSATAVGLLLGASFAGYVAGLLAAGPLVARAGARTVAAGGGIAATVGLAGVAAAAGPLTLGLAATIGGASTGLASPALAAAVEARLPVAHRATGQTAINAGTSLGLVVAVPVAVATAATWRLAWGIFAFAALLVTIGVAAAVPSGRPAVGPIPCLPGRLGARLRVSAVLLGVGSAAFWGFARELLETVSQLPPEVTRATWVAAGAVGLLGALAGRVADRVGLRAAVAGAGVLLAAALAVLSVGPRPAVVALAAAGGFGAAYMAMTGLLVVWSVRERPDTPASAVAAAFLLLALGQIAGSPLAGAIGDHAGLGAAFAVAAVVAAGTAVALPARHHTTVHEAAPAAATGGARP